MSYHVIMCMSLLFVICYWCTIQHRQTSHVWCYVSCVISCIILSLVRQLMYTNKIHMFVKFVRLYHLESKYGVMGCDVVGWDVMGSDVMWCDVMGCDGMEWNGTGFEGTCRRLWCHWCRDGVVLRCMLLHLVMFLSHDIRWSWICWYAQTISCQWNSMSYHIMPGYICHVYHVMVSFIPCYVTSIMALLVLSLHCTILLPTPWSIIPFTSTSTGYPLCQWFREYTRSCGTLFPVMCQVSCAMCHGHVSCGIWHVACVMLHAYAYPAKSHVSPFGMSTMYEHDVSMSHVMSSLSYYFISYVSRISLPPPLISLDWIWNHNHHLYIQEINLYYYKYVDFDVWCYVEVDDDVMLGLLVV